MITSLYKHIFYLIKIKFINLHFILYLIILINYSKKTLINTFYNSDIDSRYRQRDFTPNCDNLKYINMMFVLMLN